MSAVAIDRSWMVAAACADTDPALWFPDQGELVPPETRHICATCPVAEPCLAYALAHEEHGVWAGTSPRQRMRIRRREKIRLVSPPTALRAPGEREAASW